MSVSLTEFNLSDFELPFDVTAGTGARTWSQPIRCGKNVVFHRLYMLYKLNVDDLSFQTFGTNYTYNEAPYFTKYGDLHNIRYVIPPGNTTDGTYRMQKVLDQNGFTASIYSQANHSASYENISSFPIAKFNTFRFIDSVGQFIGIHWDNYSSNSQVTLKFYQTSGKNNAGIVLRSTHVLTNSSNTGITGDYLEHVFVLDDKIYFTTAKFNTQTRTIPYNSIAISIGAGSPSRMFEYNPSTNTLTEKTNAPPYYASAALVLSDNIYMIGGATESLVSDSYTYSYRDGNIVRGTVTFSKSLNSVPTNKIYKFNKTTSAWDLQSLTLPESISFFRKYQFIARQNFAVGFPGDIWRTHMSTSNAVLISGKVFLFHWTNHSGTIRINDNTEYFSDYSTTPYYCNLDYGLNMRQGVDKKILFDEHHWGGSFKMKLPEGVGTIPLKNASNNSGELKIKMPNSIKTIDTFTA